MSFLDCFVYVTLARNIANSININSLPSTTHSLTYNIVSNSLIIIYFYMKK